MIACPSDPLRGLGEHAPSHTARGPTPLLGLDARAERLALADPASRCIGPVFASRIKLFLTSISTIVVVAGQTQVHGVIVVGAASRNRAANRARVSAARNAYVTNA